MNILVTFEADLKVEVINLLTDLTIAGIKVNFIPLDNAGENRAMKNDLDVKSFGVKFEFSGTAKIGENSKLSMERFVKSCEKRWCEG
jgi:hypothetical protein